MGPLAITIQPYSLDLGLAWRQADVPSLVGLIAIEPAPGLPFALRIEHAFLRHVDTDQRRRRRRRP